MVHILLHTKMRLTKRQKEIYTQIQEYMEDSGGISPTLAELMETSGITTKKGVAFHLDALEKKGFIVRTGDARGIRLVSDSSGSYIKIPLLGYANAGEPLIKAEEEFHGELLVEKQLLTRKRKVFGVELRGDSMDKKSINGVLMENGNFVIISKESQVVDGDVVLVVINDGATVKTYKREDEMFVLYPESSNPIHKPIYMNPDSGQIVGKVITVLNNPTKE